jgi:YD repeat-containing protein
LCHQLAFLFLTRYVETDPRTTGTNPLGKQTTYHFTTLHGVGKVKQVEGHPSTNCAVANKEYTYDADGFFASKTDWQGNITSYTRNAKGQKFTRTEVVGTRREEPLPPNGMPPSACRQRSRPGRELQLSPF